MSLEPRKHSKSRKTGPKIIQNPGKARICGKSRQIKAIREEKASKIISQKQEIGSSQASESIQNHQNRVSGVQNHQNPAYRSSQASGVHISHQRAQGVISGSRSFQNHQNHENRVKMDSQPVLIQESHQIGHLSLQIVQIQESASKIISKS